eukprot:3904242-Prymnesium_polylepis.1
MLFEVDLNSAAALSRVIGGSDPHQQRCIADTTVRVASGGVLNCVCYWAELELAAAKHAGGGPTLRLGLPRRIIGEMAEIVPLPLY